MWEINNVKKNIHNCFIRKNLYLKSFFAHDNAFNLSHDIEMSCLQGQTITSSKNSSLPLYAADNVVSSDKLCMFNLAYNKSCLWKEY